MEWRELERRATGACVRFFDQSMPPGSSHPCAAVGFENDPADCRAILFLERGINYDGENREIREWFHSGQKRFSSFENMRRWIQTDLARAFALDGPCHTVIAPSELTDLNKVAVPKTEENSVALDQSELARKLQVRIRGQDSAIVLVAKRVSQFLSKRQPQRPLSLVFCGPTGVGKTQTAEALAAVLPESVPGFRHLRIDLAEFKESHRVSQMLGAPPGYIGHGDGAPLVDLLSSHRRCLVLFDEFEKAHPDVSLALMNAIDSGRLSAPSKKGRAREIDCREALFIFTSNLDWDDILDDLTERDAFGEPELTDQICRRRFRLAGVAPELIGRINSFVVFLPLADTAKAEIAALSIRRAAEEYGVTVAKISPEAVSALLQVTNSTDFDARPYEHAADDLFGNLFATAARLNRSVELRGEGPFHCTPIKPSTTEPKTKSYGQSKH